MKLYLVAGHGGNPYDPGAVGCGYKEAEVARKIAAALKDLLKDKIDIIVYDTSKNLYVSQNYSFFEKGSYVLEIHLNSFTTASANGVELLINTGFSADKYDKAIYNIMAKYFTGRGIKNQSLRNAKNFASRGIAYSLLEVCFISNQNDMNKLMNNFNAIMVDLANTLSGLFGGGTVTGGGSVSSGGGSSVGGSGSSSSGGSTGSTAGEYTVKVTADELNIRSVAGTGYKVVGSIKDKGTYTIVQTSGDWGKLKSGAGWIHLGYTTKRTASTGGPYTVKITASELRVRKGAGTSYAIATVVKKGEVYTIVQESNGWGKLKSGAGWISLEYTQKV